MFSGLIVFVDCGGYFCMPMESGLVGLVLYYLYCWCFCWCLLVLVFGGSLVCFVCY